MPMMHITPLKPEDTRQLMKVPELAALGVDVPGSSIQDSGMFNFKLIGDDLGDVLVAAALVETVPMYWKRRLEGQDSHYYLFIDGAVKDKGAAAAAGLCARMLEAIGVDRQRVSWVSPWLASELRIPASGQEATESEAVLLFQQTNFTSPLF